MNTSQGPSPNEIMPIIFYVGTIQCLRVDTAGAHTTECAHNQVKASLALVQQRKRTRVESGKLNGPARCLKAFCLLRHGHVYLRNSILESIENIPLKDCVSFCSVIRTQFLCVALTISELTL